jgi:hypothetical protein
MSKYPTKSRENFCPVFLNIGVMVEICYFYISKKLCNKRKEENFSYFLQYKLTYSSPSKINFLDNNLAVLEFLSPPASNCFWPVNISMDTCSLEYNKSILDPWRKSSETLVYQKSLNCESIDNHLLWSDKVYSVRACLCVCTYIYIYIYVCVCVYIYIYIYIYWIA